MKTTRHNKHSLLSMLLILVMLFSMTNITIGATAYAAENHTHTNACYAQAGDIMCGLIESDAHTHEEDCHCVGGELICSQVEVASHIHDDTCYTDGEIICGLTETEGHTHCEGCYCTGGELTCTLEERDGHIHTDACHALGGELICTQNESEKEQVYGISNRMPKELTNVITDIGLWDVSNGRYVYEKDGVLLLSKDQKYSFETKFDLSAYNGDLENGDTFTLTVPEPFTVSNGTIELTDSKSGLVIGLVTVTANGEGLGGTVKIVLQRLDEYLEQTGGSELRDVKGTFYVNFTASELQTDKTITYNSTETLGDITHRISVIDSGHGDHSDEVANDHFNKGGGVLKKEPYTSAVLGISGTYVHPWWVRINISQASYNTIVITDTVSESYAPMQIIPETLKLYCGYYDNSYAFISGGTLTEGVDYSIQYNPTFTEFNITILNASARLAGNGKPCAYELKYRTTAPADGSQVANTISVTGDEIPITISTTNTNTESTAIRDSKITEGGTISLDVGYRIVLYKMDSETGKMLSGAVFKVTTPTGEEITLPATDENGRTYSRTFTSEEVAKGNFIVTEVTSPAGFELDTTPIVIKVGAAGVIKTIKNNPEKVSISVDKQWVGTTKDSVTVKLLADGVVKESAVLTAAGGWTHTFENLRKYDAADGHEIVYTIEEVQIDGYTTGISGSAKDGFTITNTITGKVSVPVTKKWIGEAGASVTINLLANGTKVDSATLNEGNNWQYTFTDLEQYNAGQEIAYTIEEISMNGYDSVITGNA